MRWMLLLPLCSCAGTQVIPSVGYAHSLENTERLGMAMVTLTFVPPLPTVVIPVPRRSRLGLDLPDSAPVPVSELTDGSTVIEGSWGRLKLGSAAAIALGTALLGLFVWKKRKQAE